MSELDDSSASRKLVHRASALRAFGVTPTQEVSALLKDALIPEAVLEQLINDYSTIPVADEGTLVHRTLDGSYEYCHTHTCELVFHFPDVTIEQMEFVPQSVLLPMLEITQPPSYDIRNQPETLQQLRMLSFSFGSRARHDESVASWQELDGKDHWGNDRYLTHRDYDLPAVIRESGTVEWCQHGQLHRDNDKPALVKPDGSEHWYYMGNLHRGQDLPAVVEANGTREWYYMGKLFREGAPAKIHHDGTQVWYENPDCRGEIHRDGGPALIEASGHRLWYQYGKKHRDDGPAVVNDAAGVADWYLHGKQVRPWYGLARWQVLQVWLPLQRWLMLSRLGQAAKRAISWTRGILAAS